MQIVNERVFSLEGRVATPLRHIIDTNIINNLIAIAKHYYEFKKTEMEPRAQPRTFDESSDFLMGLEDVEMDDRGSRNVSASSKNFENGSANESVAETGEGCLRTSTGFEPGSEPCDYLTSLCRLRYLREGVHDAADLRRALG